MYRIDDPSASTTLPTPEAALTEGYWTEGNPGSGIPATLERASWFNMVQEELRNIVLAGGLTPSKTNYTQVRDAINAYVGHGRLVRTSVYTLSGSTLMVSVNGVPAVAASSTWTPLSSSSQAIVEGVAGGGGGGGCPATSTGQQAAAGGGQAGVYARIFVPSPLSPQVIAIGALGAAGAAGSNAGGAGGTTSFGSVLTLPGGAGGGAGVASSVTLSLSTVANGTNGPSISGAGTLAYQVAMAGAPILVLGTATGALVGGCGGSSLFGSGGQGSVAGVSSARPGLGYGVGGGGGALAASSSAVAGQPGTAGLLTIYEYA